MSEEMIRSFIAIELGSQALAHLISFQRALLDTGADLKIVEAGNIHITLRFLGNMSLNLINRISEGIKDLQFQPFEVSIQGTGVFPELRHINVVWVGIKKGVIGLMDIHSQVDSQLKKLGIRLDDGDFSPHITVARVRSGRHRDKLTETILCSQDEEFGVFEVNSVKLKKSVLTRNGPIYTTLTEVKATEN